MSVQTDFINSIAPYVQKWQKQYGFGVCSAIIAQACLESAFGQSDKAQYNNYFGLKYKGNRVTCNSGKFTSTSAEWKDGKYYPIITEWYAFADMDDGVQGYFQFIGSGKYKVKGITDPEAYLQALKDGGYATSPNYVANNMRVVDTYGLRKYDEVNMVQYDLNRKPDSPLAKCAIWTFNCSIRNTKLKPSQFKFVPHCTAGMSSAEATARRFQRPEVQASATYCIGSGHMDIVQNVPEEYRPWTTGGDLNVNGVTGAMIDHMAFTFEIANTALAPDYPMSMEALTSLIYLMADICKRYGIKKVYWNNDKYFSSKAENYNTINVHRWYARKSCPGNFLMNCMPTVADSVNLLLANGGDIPSGEYVIEGVDYSEVFNSTYYRDHNPDVAASPYGVNDNTLWEHFRDFGMNELRRGNEMFDARAYKERYEDLRNAYGDSNQMYYWHWIVFGKAEGRNGL